MANIVCARHRLKTGRKPFGAKHLAPWKLKEWIDMHANYQGSRPNLTDARIKKTSWNGKEQRLTDPKLPGFFVSINKHTKTYKIKADLWVGEPGRKKKVRTITHAIGDAQNISVRDARDKAADLLRKIHAGEDPFRQGTEQVSSSIKIEQLIDLFIADRIRKKRREATIKNYQDIAARYLADIHHLPISEFEEADAYDLHNHITDNRGPVVADQTIRLLRAAYRFGKRRNRGAPFPRNPAEDFEFNPSSKKRPRSLDRKKLGEWYTAVQGLPNPLRREMHLFSLYSGLRKRSLTLTERDWICFDERAIKYPSWAMKSRRDFHLPLSNQLVEITERALSVSEVLFPRSKWLFPTRSREGKVIPTSEVKEKHLPRQIGHVLRRSHRTMAQRVGVNEVNGRLLEDHTVPGISGVYVDDSQLFDKLLIAQQDISDELDAHIFLNPS